MVSIFLFGDPADDVFGWLFAVCFAAVFLGGLAVNVGKSVRRHASLASRIGSIVTLGFIGFVAVSIGGSFLASQIDLLSDISDLPLLLGIGGIVLVNVLFFFLMGAPTPLGRRLMDGIEGLRLYLTVAERDRMNMQGAPTMSPQHFETLLPYAVALGVEKPWSRTFETWLARPPARRRPAATMRAGIVATSPAVSARSATSPPPWPAPWPPPCRSRNPHPPPASPAAPRAAAGVAAAAGAGKRRRPGLGTIFAVVQRRESLLAERSEIHP